MHWILISSGTILYGNFQQPLLGPSYNLSGYFSHEITYQNKPDHVDSGIVIVPPRCGIDEYVGLQQSTSLIGWSS